MKFQTLTRCLVPILGLLSSAAFAQTNTPLSTTPRMQQSGRIDYVALGASFRTGNGNGGSPCTVKTGPGTTNAGGGATFAEVVANNAVVLNTDRPAVQQVPVGSSIKAAYLYWAASQTDGVVANADNQVSFTVNGVTTGVTANRVWTGLNSNGGSMGAMADVTSLIPSVTAANSTMRMDGLSIQNNADQCSNSTVHGVWNLYIVYENAGLSSKLVSFYDGLEYIGGTAGIASKAITATGFSVPNASSLDRVSKTTVMVAEGDFDATVGDSVTLQSNVGASATLSSTSRPANNFFGGVVSYEDETGTETRQAGSANTVTGTTGGLDIATMTSPTSVIPAGTRSITATITAGGGELLIAHSMVVMANTSDSNVRVVKSLEGAATTYTVGDTLRYLLTVDNRQGTYEALDVVTTDTLPRGLTYNSAEISYDGGATWTALGGVTSTVNGTTGVTTITLPTVRRIDPDGKVWGGSSSVATQLGSQDVRYRLTVTANGDVFGNLTNTATVTNGSAEANTADNTSTQPVTINRRSDLAIDKSGPAAVGAGQTLTYRVRVWNNGPSSTGTVSVADTLPAGFTVTGLTCTVTGTATCGTQGYTSSSVTITTGTLSVDTAPGNATPDGNYLTYAITGTAPTTSGTLQNQAGLTVPSGVTDGVTGNNTSAPVLTRIINAVNDAGVTVSSTAGGTIAVLTNDTNGAGAATTGNSAVTVSNAGGLTGVSVNGNGELVVPAGTPAGTYTVAYQVCDSTLTSACDTATVPVTVQAATPDLTLTLTGPAFARPSTVASTNPPVTASDSFISYALTVAATTANATGTTTVTTTLPSGLSWTGAYSATPGTWNCSVSGQVITCTTTSTITVGTPQTITLNNVKVAPGPAAGPTFTTSSVVSNAGESAADAATGNAASATTRLILSAVTKSVRNVTADSRDNSGVARFGTASNGLPTEVLEYCIEVENLGGADLANYVLTDALNTLGVAVTTVTTDAAYGSKAIKWTRSIPNAAPTTGNYTAAAGDDAGTLNTSLRVTLGTVLAGETVRTCFQTRVR